EFVFGKGGVQFADGGVEPEEDPLVIAGEKERIDLALGLSGLELAEAAGVPELVAEIAAQLHLLFIVENVLPQRRGSHHSEAQGVGAILADEVEGVRGIAQALGHFAALLVTNNSGEID